MTSIYRKIKSQDDFDKSKNEKGIFNFHHEQSVFLHFKCADID